MIGWARRAARERREHEKWWNSLPRAQQERIREQRFRLRPELHPYDRLSTIAMIALGAALLACLLAQLLRFFA